MTDKPKTMTWADLAAWITSLTPEQLAMRAVLFDKDAGEFASASGAFLASKDDEGRLVYGKPTSELAEGQPILQIY